MGFFSRLFAGLAKARNSIMSGLDEIFSGFSQIDDDFYEEIEEILVMADLGIATASDIIENLKVKVKEQHIKEPAACKELLVQTIKEQMDIGETAYEFEHRQSVLLVVGVNGVGKTTTIGKLAAQYIREGKTVVLAAADTFRAAAADQLEIWAQRAGAALVRQHEGADPASVVYDACQSAKAKNADILIVDTAGRLHNKKNLMEELKKINRVIDREFPGTYRETLVVLDGTTGQNALVQARQFKEAVNISGIVLTKMDGTAKGGIAVAIQAELGVPVKYIGVGEQIDDLQKFDADSFVNALFDIQMDDREDEDDKESAPGNDAAEDDAAVSTGTTDFAESKAEEAVSAAVTAEPAADAGELAAETAEPAADTAEPAAGTEESAADTAEPAACTEESVADTAVSEADTDAAEAEEADTAVSEAGAEEPAAQAAESAAEEAEDSDRPRWASDDGPLFHDHEEEEPAEEEKPKKGFFSRLFGG